MGVPVTNMSHNVFTATGIPVAYSYYSDQEPSISHGTIQLENQSKDPLRFSIRKIWCQVDDEIIPIGNFFVYKLPNYDVRESKSIHQPPRSTIQYEITFPKLSAVPYLDREIQIAVELEAAGEVVTVLSPYTISRRTKKRV
jgi:hypothetical protein